MNRPLLKNKLRFYLIDEVNWNLINRGMFLANGISEVNFHKYI
ncbi:hypothetical protein SAMN05216524_106473 [Mucilaginibacter sp. OK098]|nr:hypothetical protein SAMN05216524_106473 [Mucilaginibacter sp. OK098]